jgi:hypothetical protein
MATQLIISAKPCLRVYFGDAAVQPGEKLTVSQTKPQISFELPLASPHELALSLRALPATCAYLAFDIVNGNLKGAKEFLHYRPPLIPGHWELDLYDQGNLKVAGWVEQLNLSGALALLGGFAKVCSFSFEVVPDPAPPPVEGAQTLEEARLALLRPRASAVSAAVGSVAARPPESFSLEPRPGERVSRQRRLPLEEEAAHVPAKGDEFIEAFPKGQRLYVVTKVERGAQEAPGRSGAGVRFWATTKEDHGRSDEYRLGVDGRWHRVGDDPAWAANLFWKEG